MFHKWKDYFLSLITTRVIYLIIAFCILCGILIRRIFTLQVIEGEQYLTSFELKTKKEITINAARGNIYDRNGVLLAYNELAYSVNIQDVFPSGKNKNQQLNDTILRTIAMIEENGDSLSANFNIYVDERNQYQFSVTGTSLNRFKADIYGHVYIDEMSYAESSSTAEEIMEYLTGDTRYNVDTSLPKETVLKIIAIRYAMSANTYQKYIATTIATGVSQKTVAVIMENSDILQGVSIAEDTIRIYPTGTYTSQIVGYTGKISSDELAQLQETDPSYSANDIIGKTGIEASQEAVLKGEKGSETVYVDTMGRIISVEDLVDAVAGNDVYLTIDANLQEAIYHILEQKLAGILLNKIINYKEYIPAENASSSDILIPIYDVYYALLNNEVIDITHISKDDAQDNERVLYAAYLVKKEAVLEKLIEELTTKRTAYKKLNTEWQNYQNYVETLLLNDGILVDTLIDRADETYKAWANDEVISLGEYIDYCISQNWIDTSKLTLSDSYSQSSEIFDAILEVVKDELSSNKTFDKMLYRYIVKADSVAPKTLLNILLEQNVVQLSDEELDAWKKGRISSYTFMINRISNLEITPAQLALEPYSASCVITDTKTGDTLALVSYPSYDNNYLANGADTAYLRKMNSDLSTPLINYATQQKTAPGSTFKMVTSTAGLKEGVITPNTLITCLGSFKELTTDVHNCWIYPGRHGALNLSAALEKSCNYYYYTVGYKMSMDENNQYNSNIGIEKLTKYAEMYGLGEKSGVEIEESTPQISTQYSVPSAIGQGTNSYTTVSLARYVTAVANSGTVFKLTLIDRITDSNGELIKDNSAEIVNQVELEDNEWRAIHEGMRRMAQSQSYFKALPFEIAGKTGTAEQSRTKPNHALFVCYAPYDDPEIAMAIRIANGYTSAYPADTACDILKHYYNVEDVVTETATEVTTTGIGD
ncbi:MAG: penicillin-binding protein [Lachnospiraceae bacterium]|nr:penicillin-binding protein [Lachnospiraceae bacterium]